MLDEVLAKLASLRSPAEGFREGIERGRR